MKARVEILVVGLIAVVSAPQANSAFRYDNWWRHTAPSGQPAEAASNVRPSAYDEMLIANGVDPSSDKGRLILAWIARIDGDPVVIGNIQRVSKLFVTSSARAELMADGLERMLPALRLEYVALVTKILDTLVPVDCFGLNDMSAVIDRVPLSAMADADIDEYFRILLAGLRAADADTAPERPTPQRFAQAEASLKLSLLRELGYTPADVARYAAYSANPQGANPRDACWAMRVTMHAILGMPDSERDVVVRGMVQSRRVSPAPSR
ncbi:hypothetical protein AWB73_06746 [Caballeronia turbans]|jgi:hypothetical protein|nr:hypothetical protein AWB73_06746 [Caballeronia turbans]